MKNYFILLFICCFGPLQAQVQFEAKVSKQTLGINERLRIDFSMNADGDNFTPPSFEGFRVVAGPSQQVSQSWVNGRSSFNKTYSYYLLPSQRGVLTIRQASIEINGQIYKTSPVKITVTAAVEQPRDPNDVQISADDALHLVADVSKTNPYINEPITVVYKLYFSYNIGITNWRELDKPKYNDFWSQNIDIKQLQVEEGKFNGEKYRYVVLRKTVLYPQKSGKLEIEPLSLDIDVELPSNRRTIFGQIVAIQDHKRVSAGARTINVKPLPEAGKPDDFSGAVGKFDFKVTPSQTNIKNGESLELNVSVSGNGNLKLFNLPKPVVPSALEMYDPVHKENVNTTLSGMSGKISDSYTIIPQFKGKYPVQAMSFTYFDPSAGRYKTINSPGIMINVLDGPMESGAVAETGNEPAKMKISGAEQFKFIRLKTSLTPVKQKDFFGSGTFYALALLPFLCIPLVVLLRKKKEAADNDIAGNRIRMSNRLARKYLSEAKNNLGNKEQFYVSLEKAMHNFLKAKLNIETSEMSKDKIREILLARNAQRETVDDFIRLTENCEFARYAPSSSVAINQDYEKAVNIISELEKQL
ncbi:MAG TPA: BatD family protein [Flavobacterium sp.]|jgi:hypothetical protein